MFLIDSCATGPTRQCLHSFNNAAANNSLPFNNAQATNLLQRCYLMSLDYTCRLLKVDGALLVYAGDSHKEAQVCTSVALPAGVVACVVAERQPDCV
jgi:hypothetical protein